ncbi:Adenylyltransferase and sulfurtransferase MOCS3 [Toxocara canis]|uniref:Adenylyltransferase and sulfurtransferase MOCS3 homolog n=1 Tax=Toxocara canis TaxID=6265 RepID=A0A0B2UY49_TOXCA|nr:Adenylyltransferase and sulfurtransferase MOCS3 [Toxocara canis]
MSFSCYHDLSFDEIRRYSRQILVEEIGVDGQQRLRDASLLIVGAGGLGCPVGLYTAAAGIGRIGIVDGDSVSEDNLHRQISHCESSVDTSKAVSLRDAMLRLNSSVQVDVHLTNLSSTNALEVMKGYDIIADCTDNAPARWLVKAFPRYLINDACVMLNKPLVWGSALRWEGQLTVYNFPKDCPCYRCIFPVPPPREAVTNCAESGVVGPVVGVIGSMQALEVIKIAAGLQTSFSGRLFLFDGQRGETRNVRLRSRRQDCSVCGLTPSVTQLTDYALFCGSSPDDKTPRVRILVPQERITASELAEMNFPIIVDVRSKNQFQIAHLPNAKNIPFADLKKMNASQVLNSLDVNADMLRERGVCVICRRGNDSQLAVIWLRKALKQFCDRDRIVDVQGGYEAWAQLVDPSFPVY